MENNRGLKVLSVRGVPIYLKPSWFMLMLLVCVGYPVYLYQQSELAWSSAITIALSLGGLVALGVLIHELGHALAAVALKVRVQYISLTLWGGVTKIGAATPWSSLIISLAGPVVNLLFAV
ncbi:MAG: site-2 protease family protein, partial [Rothia sp. (in: high G+C Gram-positive bacteria)]|nr:site-2 protease family protein [Rothia sp. (in: high G+C Gram-positive bacteria)]